MTADPIAVPPPFHRKWWIYQRERFPLAGHGPLIAAFSFCAVSLSTMLRGSPQWPSWRSVVVAFFTCCSFFLQLRIADEFKDLEDDRRYRPYRPVPRGLVTLRELARLFIILAVLQLSLAIWLDIRLLTLLAITWTYLALMSKEFFVGSWLRTRPVLYMLTHMLIMPLVDFYATSADWMPVQQHAPSVLWGFLMASYCNGLVIEIGRKIRNPTDEEPGVDTYTALWGKRAAVGAWTAALVGTFFFAMTVAIRLGHPVLIGSVLLLALIGAIGTGLRFLSSSTAGVGKWVETASGIWTLSLYLTLGLLPRLAGGVGR